MTKQKKNYESDDSPQNENLNFNGPNQILEFIIYIYIYISK